MEGGVGVRSYGGGGDMPPSENNSIGGRVREDLRAAPRGHDPNSISKRILCLPGR